MKWGMLVDQELDMLKDENTRLRVLAEHDWLTGLYNRRAAEAHVDEALLKNGGGMLLVLDIDHFKQVNDRYSFVRGGAHAAGYLFSARYHRPRGRR